MRVCGGGVIATGRWIDGRGEKGMQRTSVLSCGTFQLFLLLRIYSNIHPSLSVSCSRGVHAFVGGMPSTISRLASSDEAFPLS